MKIRDAKPQLGIFEIVEGKILSDTKDTQDTSEISYQKEIDE